MTLWWITLAVVAVLVVLAVAVSSLARRIDRLHKRQERARQTLEAQLVHRAEAALEVAGLSELEDGCRIVLTDSAREAGMSAPRLVGEGDPNQSEREEIESALTANLRVCLGPVTAQQEWAQSESARAALAALASEHYRVRLARRFHNDAVIAVCAIRKKALVRLLHLAGRAPLPQTFEMDEDLDVFSLPGQA